MHFIISNFREDTNVNETASYWIDIRQETCGETTTFQAYRRNRKVFLEEAMTALVEAGYKNNEIEVIKDDLARVSARYDDERPRAVDPAALLHLIKSYPRLRRQKGDHYTTNQFIVLDHMVWYVDWKKGLVEYRGVDVKNLACEPTSPWIQLGDVLRYNTSLDVALKMLGLKKGMESKRRPHGRLAYRIEATTKIADPTMLLTL
ncbi:MAG: hypothetical protein JRN68_03280 [Nitrososphaerota archaeon]|nr:hypothetical protein [Ferrimicrobium acidiphilum]MDG6933700.1 hypothetical protein [Nitrososphaerota archaeon]